MKKIPQKKLNRLNALQQQMHALDNEYEKRTDELQKEYEPYIDYFDFTEMDDDLTDAHYNYLYDQYEIYANFNKRQRILDAKWMATFLIATNIARRGKVLHPEVAKRKLKKYNNKYGNYIKTTLKTPFILQTLDVDYAPHLARELYESYDVMLLNKDRYVELVRYILMYPGKETDKYKNLLKKFHKQNIFKCAMLEKHKIDERPF